MPRNKGGLWEAMKAGKFWHEPEPKPKPANELPKPIKPVKEKKDKPCPNQENTQAKPSKTSGKSQPDCTKRTNIPPKEDNPGPYKMPSANNPHRYFPEPDEKKVDIPFNNPDRPSQTGVGCKGKNKNKTPKGKVLDLDLWEGDATEIYPKITVMPHGLRFIGTHEEFMRLANKLLSS